MAARVPKREPAGPPQVSLVAGGSGEPMHPAPGRRLRGDGGLRGVGRQVEAGGLEG